MECFLVFLGRGLGCLLNTRRLERFSFECRKVIGFAFTTLRDWFKNLAPLFHPIRSKTKSNHDSFAHVFPRFASATCNRFEFWLVRCNVYGPCDWLEWLLWFWFYDTQLKTALRSETGTNFTFYGGLKHKTAILVFFCSQPGKNRPRWNK